MEFLKLPITFFLSVSNLTIIICLSTLPVENYSKTEVLNSQPSYQDLLTPIVRNKIQCRILKHAVNVRLQDNPNVSNYCLYQFSLTSLRYCWNLKICRYLNLKTGKVHLLKYCQELITILFSAGCAFEDTCLIPRLGPLRKELVQCPKVALSCLTSLWNALIAL